jgi:tetraacyldisaccharide 4'-kinase
VRAPAFWWEPRPTVVACLLAPLGYLWGWFAGRRMSQAGFDCGIPVICVGNFVSGGAGKTPIAIHVGEMLKRKGENPAFLTRGYGGRASAQPTLVDPAKHTAVDVGDEPLLLARVAPTFAGGDRCASAKMAIVRGATVLIMDDGLQNPSLRKNLTIAVVDGAVGLGNGLCIPAGPLRAPMGAQLARVDAIVVIGDGAAGAAARECAGGRGVFSARLVPDESASKRLKGVKVLGFAGIGRPEKFFATLREIGAEVVATKPFADHHPYSGADIANLERQAVKLGAILVTTEKDAMRIQGGPQVETVQVRIELSDDVKFAGLIERASMSRSSTERA